MPESSPIGIGIVGAGFAARFHARALRTVPGVEIRAIAARSETTARIAAAELGIPHAVDDYLRLCADPEIDALCVCVPGALHEEVIVAAARAGKHVICEKPLTGAYREGASAAEALAEVRASTARITREVRRAGIVFCYAENWVYAPVVERTRALLDHADARMLDIRAEQSHSGSHAPSARYRVHAGGGALLTLGSHAVACVLELTAAEAERRGERIVPTAVVASVAPGGPRAPFAGGSGDVETWANAVIEFSDGSRGAVAASFSMHGGVRNRLEVYADTLAVRAELVPTDTLEVFAAAPDVLAGLVLREKVDSNAGWTGVEVEGDRWRGYPQEMADFVGAIRGGHAPRSDLALARSVAEVVYSAYVAAEEGRRVMLPQEEER
ncbi:MAG: Gfo/Idh/MocA family oxidoreductase [Cryobacterium sp.]|nr:Gfo/Idh/MocA family oxidoreductase [Cryobacterium sp.]